MKWSWLCCTIYLSSFVTQVCLKMWPYAYKPTGKNIYICVFCGLGRNQNMLLKKFPSHFLIWKGFANLDNQLHISSAALKTIDVTSLVDKTTVIWVSLNECLESTELGYSAFRASAPLRTCTFKLAPVELPFFQYIAYIICKRTFLNKGNCAVAKFKIFQDKISIWPTLHCLQQRHQKQRS